MVDANFENSTIIIICITGVLIILFFACLGVTVYLCVQIKNEGNRNMVQVQSSVPDLEAERLERFKQRLNKQFQKSKKKYKKARSIRPHSRAAQSRETPCAVCLEKYDMSAPHNEMIGVINACGHFYHFDCIWPWVKRQESCPVCRHPAKLTDPDVTAVCFSEVLDDRSLTVRDRSVGVGTGAGLGGGDSVAVIDAPPLPPPTASPPTSSNPPRPQSGLAPSPTVHTNTPYRVPPPPPPPSLSRPPPANTTVTYHVHTDGGGGEFSAITMAFI